MIKIFFKVSLGILIYIYTTCFEFVLFSFSYQAHQVEAFTYSLYFYFLETVFLCVNIYCVHLYIHTLVLYALCFMLCLVIHHYMLCTLCSILNVLFCTCISSYTGGNKVIYMYLPCCNIKISLYTINMFYVGCTKLIIEMILRIEIYYIKLVKMQFVECIAYAIIEAYHGKGEK